MSYQFGKFFDPTKPQIKYGLGIILGIIVIGLSIVGGVLGTRFTPDEECTCRSKTDGGWMGFSIVYFIASLIGTILYIKFGIRCGNITT